LVSAGGDFGMSDFDDIERVKAQMYEAIGECLMAWAMVEFHLQHIFLRGLGIEMNTAIALWTTPRGLEARLNLLAAAFAKSKADPAAKADFQLLRSYVSMKVGQRNQVAHSTLIIENNTEAVLTPYYSFASSPLDSISKASVQQWTTEFNELANALFWFFSEKALSPPLRRLGSAAPQTPDLLLRLREEDARRREGKRFQRRPSPA
jgi:hypothetical protein